MATEYGSLSDCQSSESCSVEESMQEGESVDLRLTCTMVPSGNSPGHRIDNSFTGVDGSFADEDKDGMDGTVDNSHEMFMCSFSDAETETIEDHSVLLSRSGRCLRREYSWLLSMVRNNWLHLLHMNVDFSSLAVSTDLVSNISG
jgi:hypothetical protein